MVSSSSAVCRDTVLAEDREELIASKQVIYIDRVLEIAIICLGPL
jgi:hypothetical protein